MRDGLSQDELLNQLEVAERLLSTLEQIRSLWRELPSVADVENLVDALDQVSDALQEARAAAKSIPRITPADIQQVRDYRKAFRQAKHTAELTPEITQEDIARVRQYVQALSEVMRTAQQLPYREGLDG